MRTTVLLFLLLSPVLANGGDVKPFDSIDAYWIEGTANDGISDLSGLAICNGKLLAISDKINDSIFEITIREHTARVDKVLQIPDIPPRQTHFDFPNNLVFLLDGLIHWGKMDWEAIACYHGSIYLLSERYDAVLKIQDGQSEWVATDWYQPVHRAGYLQKYNGFVEGLVVQSPEHLIVALEREPRGILELARLNHSWSYRLRPLYNDAKLDFHGRPEDVADLTEYQGKAFVLERNAAAVCQRSITTWKTEQCFSFKSIEDNPEFQYADQKFGMAEGLAITDQWTYIVYDNNKTDRLGHEKDHRTLFLRIKTPIEWRSSGY